MMNSASKDAAVQWAIGKLEQAVSLAEVERLYDWGYSRAKGSNGRKDRLRAARDAAVERIES